MNDIFTTTFEKHKKLLLESLNDYNWEEKVDWSVFDTTEDNSGAFEKLLGISEAKNPQSVTPTTPPSLTIVSVPTGDWWELYNNLPEPIKRTAIERYKLFLKDSKEPSLHFKPLKHRKGNYWSIDINANYRSVGIKTDIPNGFKIVWIFVGNHNQYDAFKNSLPTS
jgi:hypothetical protein